MHNEYTKRKVSPKDAQACLVCSNIVTTVLYNSVLQDWFYCCDLHLKTDPNFVKPLYPNDYEECLQKLATLKEEISKLDQNKKGNWESWATKFLFNQNKTTTETQNKLETSEENIAQTDASKDKDLRKKYEQYLNTISTYQQEVKKFQLNEIIFQNRIQRKREMLKIQQKQHEEQNLYSNTNPNELFQLFKSLNTPKSS